MRMKFNTKISVVFAVLLIVASAYGGSAQGLDKLQELETEHFIIKYHDLDDSTLSMIVEEAENAYNKVSSDLGYSPDNKTVIQVGTDGEDFEWGKWSGFYEIHSEIIYVQSPTQNKLNRWGDYRNAIKGSITHEFSHHIISAGYKTRFPEWLNEGTATYEAQDSIEHFSAYRKFKKAAAKNELHPLGEMDIFALLDDNDRFLAYIESYTVVEYIVSTYGHDALADLLKARRDNPDMHEVIKDTLGVSYEDFELGWMNFVKEKYGKASYDYYLYATLYFGLVVVLLKRRSRRRNQIMKKEGD